MVRTYCEEERFSCTEIGKYFLQFAKELIGLGSTLQKAKLDKLIRLAQYAENISTCLQVIGEAVGKNKEPHGQCGELDEYVRSLPDVCSGLLTETDIQRFQDLLERRAHGRAVALISHDEASRKSEAK